MGRTTEFVAGFVSELKDEEIAPEAIERAKRRAMLQFAIGAVRRMENSIKSPEELSKIVVEPTVVDEKNR